MTTAERLSRMARDIERHLGAICSVARNTRTGGLRTNQRRAVKDAVTFFAEVRAVAHAECVDSFLPRLQDRFDVPEQLRDSLLILYRQAAVHHARVDELGRRWLERGTLGVSDGAELRAQLDSLQNVYADLFAVEESALYPALLRLPEGS